MSSVSQFFGGASGPMIGEAVQFSSESPVNLTIDGKEYLRTGSVKTYSAEYAPLIVTHPSLSVYGNDTKTKGEFPVAGSDNITLYGYVAGKYIAYTSGATGSSDLTGWTNLTGGSGGSAATPQNLPFLSNNTYAVWPSASANTPLSWTSNGTSAAQVGGDFSTNGKSYQLVAHDTNFWCAVTSNPAAAVGDMAYINNANPSGTWTLGNPNIGSGVYPKTIAAGNGYLVVSAQYNTNISQKLFTASTATPATLTDRSAISGMFLINTDQVTALLFDGTYFVAILNNGKLYRAANPTGAWEYLGVAPATGTLAMATDRAGTIIISGISATFYVSRDHGSTWLRYQLYRGKAPWSTNVPAVFSFANGHWLANHSGSEHRNVIDLGAAFYDANPDLVGSQTALGTQFIVSGNGFITSPLHLRIK